MTIWPLTLQASVLIAAIVLIRAPTLRMLPKKTFTILWGVALFRLLIPAALPSRFSVYALAEKVVQADTAGVLSFSPQQAPPTLMAGSESALNAAQKASVSPFMVIWLAGMLAVALFFVISHIRCRCTYQMALPFDNDFAWDWKGTHRLRRSVEIKQSDRIASPLTYGLFRPKVLLPKVMNQAGSPEIIYVLAHEYTHIIRLDVLFKWLLAAGLCVHWFNPLVWVMYVLANRDMELSCDEAVIQLFGDTSKTDYAATLIGLEEKKNRLTPLCNSFSKNAIEERIRSVMKFKKASIITIIIAVVVVTGITTAFATVSKVKPESGKTASATSSSVPAKEGIVTDEPSSPVPSNEPLVTDEPSSPVPSNEAFATDEPASPYPTVGAVERDKPPAEPVTEDALPAYWAMGALDVDGVPYLPLIDTAEMLGYTVNVSSHTVDPNWDPQHPEAVEYIYKMIKDEELLGIASIAISDDGELLASMIDCIFCNVHDRDTNKFILRDDVVYFSAQFFKEALDTEDILP